MRLVSLGSAALVGASVAFAACTVNLEGKKFCEPLCNTTGGPGSGGNGGNGGGTETPSTGGSGGMNQGGGGGCGGDAVQPRDDGFGGQDGMPPGVFWTELFGDRSSPKMDQDGSALVITPTPEAAWFSGAGCPVGLCGAPAVVQRISGDFTVKTHVAVTLLGNGKPGPFAAAGILLADPCAPTKNSVLWDIGYQNQAAMGTDLYQTIDRQPSTPKVQPTNVVEADLYACRLGDQFYFYAATKAGALPMADSPDATLTWSTGDLDVGLTAHLNGQMPVIAAQFHSVSFAPAKIQADCISAL